jgi:tetratricopeptide (TPR) repeat protein
VGILYYIGMDYAWLLQYKKSLKYYKKWFEILKSQVELIVNSLHRIVYVYWQNGYNEEAKYYFNEQIKNCKRMIELKRNLGGKFYTYYDLSGN